jgi:cell division septum initiation protein DivIVA
MLARTPLAVLPVSGHRYAPRSRPAGAAPRRHPVTVAGVPGDRGTASGAHGQPRAHPIDQRGPTMSDQQARLDLEAKLHHLERMVAEAKAVPLSASIMLNRSEVDALLHDIRTSLPDEITAARHVVKERDDLLASARADAEQVLADARAERERLIARTEVVQAANRESDRIVEEAREQARQIRLEAEDYVDAKLANFEVVLHKTLGAVERGREKLRGRLDADQLAAEFEEELGAE